MSVENVMNKETETPFQVDRRDVKSEKKED
jgi:hypothetical protein